MPYNPANFSYRSTEVKRSEKLYGLGCVRHTRKCVGRIRVRSPLLTKYLLVSIPRGTEMFHFPRYALRITAKS